jgi:glyceraldehyde 3-phosphate dehydrogenase
MGTRSRSRRPNPGDVPWSTRHVDIVLECSGKFRTTETLDAYFAAGVKAVIVAAPAKSGALNIIMGVNDHLYEPSQHRLLTAAATGVSGFQGRPAIRDRGRTFDDGG